MKRLLIGFLFALSYFTVRAQTPPPLLPAFKFYTSKLTGFTKEQIPVGRQSFLMFFDATCPHCQKVMGVLAQHHKELANVNVYLISLDEFRSIDYFMDHYGKSLVGMKNVTLLQDRDHVFIPLFKPAKYPSMYLYSADKRLEIYSSNEVDISKILSMFKS